MAIGAARMPLFDHLGELRMRLVRIVVCLAIGVCIFYFAAPTIAQFMLLPIADYLPKGDEGTYMLTAIDPFETFTVRFTLAMWASVVATAPIILWQILAFFLPALKPSERKWFIPTFAAAVALFIIGTIFCYFLILPPAFQWLTDQGAGFAEITPRAKSYLSIIIGFEIGFGFAFELPLLVFYMVLFDVIPYKKLRENWRIVYVVLMVVSAMVTLDASPITMLLMFAALLMLYEGSLLIARVALSKRIKKREAQDADDDTERKASKSVSIKRAAKKK
ncbi:twin-arginine translocase subunit TatC [Adlercreutzia sp. ZJ141]|uniref:twin-arginine translocase subunit TatC n=1 Tax=Adlercreutzia sp. ZJ141 TaxID=2709406 RepID=UPI0013EB1B4D|nr:twin-arginine translocase subunit TatC [Adlercreutzia sp. ZJ141]